VVVFGYPFVSITQKNVKEGKTDYNDSEIVKEGFIIYFLFAFGHFHSFYDWFYYGKKEIWE